MVVCRSCRTTTRACVRSSSGSAKGGTGPGVGGGAGTLAARRRHRAAAGGAAGRARARGRPPRRRPDRACEERAPQLLTIVGVPGIGKSRLLTELIRAIERGDRLITGRQGRSLPYGEGVSFWAIGEMVKAQAGILDTDEPAAAERKLGEAVGRLIAAAEASTLLAAALWDVGDVDRSQGAIGRAAELAGGRTTPAAARVLAATARYAMLAERNDEAIRAGGEALRLGEELGNAEVIASALSTIGTARARQGEFEAGVADLERAVEVGLAANSPDAARTLHNLGVVVFLHEGVGRAYELWVRAKELAERFANNTTARFTSVVLINAHYRRGEWDEALRAAAEFSAGGPHYPLYTALKSRALILLARGDDLAALEAVGKSGELAHGLGRPQALLGTAAETCIILTLFADLLGLRTQVRAMLEDALPTLWTRSGAAILEGDLAGAADLLEKSGEMLYAADVRLEAARGGALEQLEPALAFFRSVGATRYVREGETLRSSASALMQTSTTTGSN